jgi:hypothetical protein
MPPEIVGQILVATVQFPFTEYVKTLRIP